MAEAFSLDLGKFFRIISCKKQSPPLFTRKRRAFLLKNIEAGQTAKQIANIRFDFTAAAPDSAVPALEG